MDEDGKILSTAPVMFHREPKPGTDTTMVGKLNDTGWHWGGTMLVDDYNHSIYTLFHRKGMVKILPVDLKTGKLTNGTELAFPFPEKIRIFKGDAYFLYKGIGESEKWKLVKCKP